MFDEIVGGTKCPTKVEIEGEVEGIVHFGLNRMQLVVWVSIPLPLPRILCIQFGQHPEISARSRHSHVWPSGRQKCFPRHQHISEPNQRSYICYRSFHNQYHKQKRKAQLNVNDHVYNFLLMRTRKESENTKKKWFCFGLSL